MLQITVLQISVISIIGDKCSHVSFFQIIQTSMAVNKLRAEMRALGEFRRFLEAQMDKSVSGLMESGLYGSREEARQASVDWGSITEARRKEDKEALGFQKCPGCGGHGERRCSGCQLAFYCNTECQRQDWKNAHKTICKEIRAQFQEVLVMPASEEDFKGQGLHGKNSVPHPKFHFVVKVGVYKEEPGIVFKSEVLSIFGSAVTRSPESQKFFEKIRKEVLEKGMERRKGSGYYIA